MQNASFSIIGYQFNKVNINLANHINNDLQLSFDTTGIFANTESKYELTFVVNVFNNNQKDTPFIMVQCVGIFQFEDLASFDDIPDFFYRNSIAILFPYVRAYVSIVTTQANVPGVILPTLNLSSLEEDLRKNTTQK